MQAKTNMNIAKTTFIQLNSSGFLKERRKSFMGGG